MKIELKAFKHFPSISEETNAFSATIYVDGKNVGQCDNRGQGGCSDYHFKDPATRNAVEKFVEALPEDEWEYDGKKYSKKQNLSDFLDDLASKIIEQKEAEKMVKKAQKIKAQALANGAKIVFQIDQGYQVSWLPLKTDQNQPRLIALIAEKYKVSTEKITVL